MDTAIKYVCSLYPQQETPSYKSPKNLMKVGQMQMDISCYLYNSDILDTGLPYYRRVTATVQIMFFREETP